MATGAPEIMADAVACLQALLQPWEPGTAAVIEEKARRLIASTEERLHHLAEPTWDLSRGVVLAAGGLLWRGPKEARRIALIHRNRYDDWSLPKGKLKPGEPLSLAARREVWEETTCQPTLITFAGLLHYLAKSRPKLVFFWHMEAADAEEFQPSDEVDQMQWFSLPEALRRLTYDIERELLTQVWMMRNG